MSSKLRRKSSSLFARMVGPVLGPMFGLEVLTAFFLEAGFLGIMLFGLDRVGSRLHYAATGLVSFGTLLPPSWILSANSWMQAPAGVALRGRRDSIRVVSWQVSLPELGIPAVVDIVSPRSVD